MNQPTARYTGPAIAAHWLIAILILAAFPLGLYMHGLPLSPNKLKLYSYHKWIGMTVLLLFVPRILWRLTHRPPAPLPMWNFFSLSTMASVSAKSRLLLLRAEPDAETTLETVVALRDRMISAYQDIMRMPV